MKRKYTDDQIAQAKAAIKRSVLIRYGDHFGPELVGVDVSDQDAIDVLDGKSIDQLMKEAK